MEPTSSNRLDLIKVSSDPEAAIKLIELIGGGLALADPDGIKGNKHGMLIATSMLMEGITPLNYMLRYDTIKGKSAKKAVTLYSDFVKAGGKVTWTNLGKDGKSAAATFTYPPYANGAPFTNSFTIEEAEKAIAPEAFKSGKGGWQRTPGAMLRSRLITETLRMIAPELVAGVYTPDELGAVEAPEDEGIIDAAFEVQPEPEAEAPAPTVQDIVDEARELDVKQRGEELMRGNDSEMAAMKREEEAKQADPSVTQENSSPGSNEKQESSPPISGYHTNPGIDENGIPNPDVICTDEQVRQMVDLSQELGCQPIIKKALESARAVDRNATPLVPKYENVPVNVPGAKHLTKDEADKIIQFLQKTKDAKAAG